MGRYTLKWVDSTQERSSRSFPVVDTAADGTDFQAINTSLLSLRDAILAVQVAPALLSQGYTAAQSDFNPSVPTNPLNQVEQRWVVEYTVNGLSGNYTDTIPCADISQGTPQSGVVILNTTAGTGLALKTQIEANFFVQEGVDAGGTGAVTVTRIYAQSS